MAIPKEHVGRFVYQFTHIENLPGIIGSGLLSTNEKRRRGIGHLSIANEGIQAHRATMPVTCGPRGVVHDYVPFYFCARSSMLLGVVNSKNVDQALLIYLAVPIQVLERSDAVFTGASANTEPPPQFYSDPSDLGKLDWESIDSQKWSLANDQKNQARMAEALVCRELAVSEIDHIIVWNPYIGGLVEKEFQKAGIAPPSIQQDGYNHKHHYFTPFYSGSQTSIVTGPVCLKGAFENTVSEVVENLESPPPTPRFASVGDAVRKLRKQFDVLPELDAIDGLQSANTMHREAVGAHTRSTVGKLPSTWLWPTLSPQAQNVLALAAFLHDIGKAKSPGADEGIQRTDLDHAVRALPMVGRILSQEIAAISGEEIRQVTMLVAYHDLVGEVIGKGRKREQILDVIETIQDFDMLAALSWADVASLVPADSFAAYLSPAKSWLASIQAGLPYLRQWVLENMKKDR